MSVVDSREERETAKAKISAAPIEVLERDLAFWSIASSDARQAFERINRERGEAVERFTEAETFTVLISAAEARLLGRRLQQAGDALSAVREPPPRPTSPIGTGPTSSRVLDRVTDG